ncbi:MAG: DUF6328 family protein, partial [Actinomycetota bacterium]|nr:DUF6328 family protein [Actinomycetota bacterium]
VFFGSLVCTPLSAGLLLAPSAHHRLLWRQQAREHRLRVANRLAIAGMVLLEVTMLGVMFVITDILFGSVAAVATAAGSGFFLYVWFLVPIRYRLNQPSRAESHPKRGKNGKWYERCMAYNRKSWYYPKRHCTTGRRDGSDGLVGQKPTTLRCCGPGR